MASTAAPVALHTTPSGKVTKWGIGTDETFTTKKAAQAALDAMPVKAPANTDEERKAARRARRAARIAALSPEAAAERKAKRAEARKARRARGKVAEAK